MNKFLVTRLSRHANAGYMYHYMDSVNLAVKGDPLLKRTKVKGHKYGWAFTLSIAAVACGLALTQVL